ncbi:M14 family zinc carboxypeptidase [Aquimarina muelleri]|uniref:Peptidase M14 n=1 Tax=Aquimarina muelleri TaxID=279356 RepID=A0A918JZZ8_9FLAO|nr:M14 family zinc carboxypeptidase [Aquimarina muelleri]MCX2764063.1 M14 family zinc carboxypeptidase [Aquimarina muelleri]GGX28173.1 peptidase M14 [Aquimarina muelleri]
MDIKSLQDYFTLYKEDSLNGRYITLENILPLLEKLSQKLEIKEIGLSENNAPIHLIKLGKGSNKLLFWSQMHGNESTTTKSLFDLLNLLTDSSNSFGKEIFKECTIYIIPILNPDGAKAYTRLNYNQVDLNRDAQQKTQKESIIFSDLVERIQPDFAFNLHGQRTIFSAGQSNYSATVSFLSPASDMERSITQSRKVAMDIIGKMNSTLQKCIPNMVGRYDDGFNLNCVGDTLSNIEIPTILFEAGHFPDDYKREKTREFIFYSLVTAIEYIATTKITGKNYEDYFLIPENGKCFYDIIIRNVILKDKNVDIAIQYSEKLIENEVKFIPKIVKVDMLQNFHGHREIQGEKREIRNENVTVEILPEAELLKFYLNSELFLIEPVKS